MDVTVVLTISVLLQFTAALLALRLIRVTGGRIAWVLIATAISLMAFRRGISLFQILSGGMTQQLDLPAELVALATSAFMLIGIASIAPLFLFIKRSEESLRESEERFRSLVETTSDWIWEVDENGVYIYASPKVRDILGYEPEEVVGKTLFDLMPADEAERVAGLFMDISRARKPFEQLENVNQHKDGRLVVLETSGVPIIDTSGEFRGYRGVDRDITERKLADDALRKSEEELKKRLKELEKFHDMAVGRELRMIELKEEIERLEKELKRYKNP